MMDETAASKRQRAYYKQFMKDVGQAIQLPKKVFKRRLR